MAACCGRNKVYSCLWTSYLTSLNLTFLIWIENHIPLGLFRWFNKTIIYVCGKPVVDFFFKWHLVCVCVHVCKAVKIILLCIRKVAVCSKCSNMLYRFSSLWLRYLFYQLLRLLDADWSQLISMTDWWGVQRPGPIASVWTPLKGCPGSAVLWGMAVALMQLHCSSTFLPAPSYFLYSLTGPASEINTQWTSFKHICLSLCSGYPIHDSVI